MEYDGGSQEGRLSFQTPDKRIQRHMNNNNSTSNYLIYGIEDKPSFGIALGLGFQHVLTLWGATTLVPLLLGPTIFGEGSPSIGTFVNSVYLGMGVATLIQLYFGSRLPIVQGSSFSFLCPVFAIAGFVTSTGGTGPQIMSLFATALILGGAIELIIGYGGFIGLLRKIITPVVIGPTIMLIGFSLAPVAVSNASKNWFISLLVVSLIFIFSLIIKGKARIFSVLSAVVIGYAVCLLLSVAGVVGKDSGAFVNFSAIGAAQWVNVPKPFFVRYGFSTDWSLILPAFFAILAAYLASIIESVGDYFAVSEAAGIDMPDKKTISQGIGAEGLGCMISGFFGGAGSTSYTENIGLVGLTKVASRFVVMIAAVILIVFSLLGKLGALIATMPSAVIGGAYIALFGMIGALGIQILSKADLKSQRNIMIVGFAFLMGLGVGNYAANLAPDLWGEAGVKKIVFDIVRAVFSTHMAVGGIIALLLDNIIPGTNEERGIS